MERKLNTQPTILITGSSAGVGKATAKHFQSKGWNVIATMRTPEKEVELTQLENILVTYLDVLDTASIASAIAVGIEKFGRIDVLLNNAGYGALGPLEVFDMDGIRRQFDTNVIGLLSVTKAVVPHFRDNHNGTIINISSMGGKVTLPLGTLYHGTKFAVEGLSEALYYEMETIGVKVKIVEPGAIKTDFMGRSFDFRNDESLSEYQNLVQKLFAASFVFSEPEEVAEVIWNAATDGSNTLRYIVGDDARKHISSRKVLDDQAFIDGMKIHLGLKYEES